MRAKIIADIAVVAAGIAAYIWWLKAMPWEALGVAPAQLIAGIISIFGTAGLIVFVVGLILHWIHEGK